MQSKSFPQKLLSFKTVFIASPCLIGMTALAAVMTSMTIGQEGQLTGSVQNTLPPVSPAAESRPKDSTPLPAIAAQPLEKKDAKAQVEQSQNFIPDTTAAPDLPTITSSKRKSRPDVAKSARQSQSAAQSTPSTPRQLPSSQSALTMQMFNPKVADDVPQIPIRVAIMRDAQRFTVATSEAGMITDSRGQVLADTVTQGAIGVSASSGRIKLGDLQSQSPLWIRSKTDKGLVFVNGRWYRGAVQLILDQGNILAVNHVEMQPYLYSVVGAEMYHSWPAEALKAQAIAARSYALVHIVRPASPHFDLGSTQRWQAYKGVGSEAGSTQSAVDATRGVVISHQGGVVESLYASSAELVRDAHKGFGMSQYGARDLAQQNLNYRQILSRFYPGTDLSLLQTQ